MSTWWDRFELPVWARVTLGALLVLLFIGSLSGDGADVIHADAYGADWPLTVTRAELRCERGSAIVLTAEGRDYGVNGTALALGYPRPDPIMRDDGPPKVSIAPLLERGLAFCASD